MHTQVRERKTFIYDLHSINNLFSACVTLFCVMAYVFSQMVQKNQLQRDRNVKHNSTETCIHSCTFLLVHADMILYIFFLNKLLAHVMY